MTSAVLGRRAMLATGASFALSVLAGGSLSAQVPRFFSDADPRSIRRGRPQPKGRAVVVGISEVDPDVYNSSMREGVEGAETDAASMADLLSNLDYEVMPPILTREAKRGAVIGALTQLAKVTAPDDIAVFYYSGHGSTTPDKDGDEPSKSDQQLVLYDQPVVDDDLGKVWQSFPAGSRLIMIADCCHSGSINKVLFDGARTASTQNTLTETVNANAAPSQPISAQMLLLSATTDEAETPGVGSGGHFTLALLRTMRQKSPPTDYESLYTVLVGQLRLFSSVMHTWEPSATDAFKSQRPFSIAPEGT